MVDDYEQDICFLVNCDRVHIQAVKPRIAWVKNLAYKVNIDETRDIIEALINELHILKPHILELMRKQRQEYPWKSRYLKF